MKEYLGDSVYAEFDEKAECVQLTTENGLPNDPSNIIWLDRYTLRSFIQFLERCKRETK